MENNTPAFPTPRFMVDKDARFNGFSVNTDGMSLRDYFAARAMQAAYSRNWDMFDDETYEHPDEAVNAIARDAYELADAMLKAREA